MEDFIKEKHNSFLKIKEEKEAKRKMKDIAIIGMDCMLPGAKGVEEFWDILRIGKACVFDFPKNRVEDAIAMGLMKEGEELRKGSYFSNIDIFDASFFRIPPKEAGFMNPNQRVLLEVAFRALQDAGFKEEEIRGQNTGVFLGYMGDFDGATYSRVAFGTTRDASPTGSLSSMMAGRISHYFDLHGPSLLFDTACSSSLVALHYACNSLRKGECESALVAGVRTMLCPKMYQSVGIESEDGYTKAFDQESSGTGIGEGAVALVLKPLEEAERDGNHIYAVVKGSAVNQDGEGIGLTAPNLYAQCKVLEKAWEDAGISPEDLSYIEAHGTGTRLGDPIEIEGMKRAFSAYTKEEGFCKIGSVKSNFGHLYDCAGLLSVLKVICMMQHKSFVPTAKFKHLNPEISLDHSPLIISQDFSPWESRKGKRVAGVSAFGFSGTNCHVVLSSYDVDEVLQNNSTETLKAESLEHLQKDDLELLKKDKEEKEALNFTFSAKSLQSLYGYVRDYRDFLGTKREISLNDLALALQEGRSLYSYRLFVQANSIEELWEKLNEILEYKLLEVSRYLPEGCSISHLKEEKVDTVLAPLKRRKHIPGLPLYHFSGKRYWLKLKEKCQEKKLFQEEEKKQYKLIGKEEGQYSKMEQALGEIFFLELGFSELSIFDRFYDLGGDSITAYRIVHRIKENYNIELTIADLLEKDSIESLANYLDSIENLRREGAELEYSKGSIPLYPEQEYYPLSYAQKRMYILYLKNPSDTSYNMPFVLKLKGKVDIEVILRCFQEIYENHDVFRSSFFCIEGEFRQRIEQKPLFIERIKKEEEGAELRWKQLMERHYDLEKDSLLRIVVFEEKLGEEYRILLGMHHIISDGSSLGIICQEFIQRYRGIKPEKAKIQYKDYALWQNSLSFQEEEKFWLEEIKDYPTLSLPIDSTTKGEKDGGEKLFFSLEEDLYQRAKEFCHKEGGCSLFVFFAAIYQLTLAIFTSSEDVIFGTAIAGRTAKETENMVGMFVNVLPIRGQLKLEDSFLEYIKKCKEKILKVLQYQDYPFDLLVEKGLRKRGGNENPFFSTVFAFQNMKIPSLYFEDFTIELSNQDERAKFDFTVEAREENGNLQFSILYKKHLFQAKTMKELFDLYEKVCRFCLYNPSSALKGVWENKDSKENIVEILDFDF